MWKMVHLPEPALTPLAKKILMLCFPNPFRRNIRYIESRWWSSLFPLNCQFHPPESRTAWSHVSNKRQRVLTTSWVLSQRLWFVLSGSQINSDVSFQDRRDGQGAKPGKLSLQRRRCSAWTGAEFCKWTSGRKSISQRLRESMMERLRGDQLADLLTIVLGHRFLKTCVKQSSPSVINYHDINTI